MPDMAIIVPSVLNGLTTGALYALVALGLTLIYGVLHIINFAHGALLMLGLYAVYYLNVQFGIDPYVALLIVPPGMFALGYALQRGIIGRASHGRDENILLITLGLSIVIDNVALLFFGGDTQTIDVPYAGSFVEVGAAFLPLPKIISFGASLVICAALGLYMAKSDMGKAIRAVARERQGARLVGIDVENVFAVSYGIGIACLGAAACLLMPTYYVTPTSGHAFVLVAFTIVVLGGMGTLFGPLYGTIAFFVLEEALPPILNLAHKGWGEYWMIVFGPLLVLIALYARGGIDSLLGRRHEQAGHD